MSGSHLDPALREHVRGLFCVREDDLMRRMLAPAQAAGLPEIQVEPEQSRLLALLVGITGARRILDIGTLFGYSAASFALAHPDVRVTSLELEPRHAQVARRNLQDLGLDGRVEVRVGDARAEVSRLQGPYDILLMDADKEGYATYYEAGLRIVRPGGLILADNVFAFGKVATRSQDPDVLAIQAFNQRVAADPRVDATILPVGDGLLVARVLPPT